MLIAIKFITFDSSAYFDDCRLLLTIAYYNIYVWKLFFEFITISTNVSIVNIEVVVGGCGGE